MKDVEIDLIQARVLDIGDMTEESTNVHINQDVAQDHVRPKGTTDVERALDTLTEIGKDEGLDHPIGKEIGEGQDHLIEIEGGRGLDRMTEREDSISQEAHDIIRLITTFLIFAK